MDYIHAKKKFASDNSITSSVSSQMIWGSQYDAMINWMALDNTIDPTKYPPKSDVTYNTSRITGATINNSTTINDKIKNVYDLTGNSFEFTQEAFYRQIRVTRGGAFYYGASPSFCILSSTNALPNYSDIIDSSRPTLYIK